MHVAGVSVRSTSPYSRQRWQLILDGSLIAMLLSVCAAPLFNVGWGLIQVGLDTLKLYTKAHGAKVSQLQMVVHIHVLKIQVIQSHHQSG